MLFKDTEPSLDKYGKSFDKKSSISNPGSDAVHGEKVEVKPDHDYK